LRQPPGDHAVGHEFDLHLAAVGDAACHDWELIGAEGHPGLREQALGLVEKPVAQGHRRTMFPNTHEGEPSAGRYGQDQQGKAGGHPVIPFARLAAGSGAAGDLVNIPWASARAW
jgi:hypothetical protein